jgi:hypothetical protein
LTNCIPLYRDRLEAVGKLPMRCMNVYLDGHVLFLSHSQATEKVITAENVMLNLFQHLISYIKRP